MEQIYIDYLFRDFLYIYKKFFLSITINNRKIGMGNAKLRVFLVQFLNFLEPRRYEESEGIIQD